MPSKEESPRKPVLTAALISLCVIIWLSVRLQLETADPVALLRRFWVFMDPAEIWNGAYFGLLGASFMHFEPIHILFNMILFWEFGSRIELTLGRQALFATAFFSALVTSGAQLFTGGWPCIGASGIVFAFFGVMLGARRQVPQFFMYLTPYRTRFFIGWLFLCLLITWFGLMPIGNAAHFSGLAFGLAISATFINRRWRVAGIAGLGALVMITALSTFWAPLNSHWLLWKYRGALAAQDTPAAEVWLDRAAGSRNAVWLNELALRLATSMDAADRNGPKAVEIATRACELSDWGEASFIDTLAAAYAEAGDWEKALATQQRALEVLGKMFEEEELNSTLYAQMREMLEANLEVIRDHKKIREAASPISMGG